VVVTIFEACGLAVEEVNFPDGSKGKCLVILDQQSGQQWRYHMDQAQTQQVVEQLSTGLVIPTALEIAAANGGKKLN
jgi:hypothetical protein